MKATKLIGIGLSLATVVFFTGCGAKGEQFAGFAKPKENQGLVYVYRPTGFVGGGVYYDVHVTNPTTTDFIAGELVNGGYIEINVPTGENEIWGKTEAKSSVTLDVKNGDIHCVKGGVGIGLLIGRPNLEVVDINKCKVEITETKKAQ